MTPRRAAALATALVVAAACGRRERQGRGTPTEGSEVPSGAYGDAVIGPAFTSATLDGVAGGPRDAQTIGRLCRGHIATGDDPSHILDVRALQPLTLSVTPTGTGIVDTTLVIMSDDGAARCADDGATLNPELADMFEVGRYRLWVGVTGETPVPYALSIRAGVHTIDPIVLGGRFPAPVASGVAPDRTTDGTFGGLRLPADTALAVLPGQAGGTRAASDLGPGCHGWIAQVPGHVLEVTAPAELTLRVRSDGDTTLAVQSAAGELSCADDEDGLNPVVRRTFSPGAYSVFVGTYEAQQTLVYTLTVSR